MFSWLFTDSLNDDCGKAMKTFVAIWSIDKNCICTAVIRIGIVLIKTHFVALRTFDPPPQRRPRVSEVGLWNQHRSGGPLGQWPTRPFSLNLPRRKGYWGSCFLCPALVLPSNLETVECPWRQSGTHIRWDC